MVHTMISNLKRQEIEIEEVTETIYENINKYRADLRFSLPEMKRVLDDLLHEHYSDTRHLVRELGEVHPMAILWEQRVEETVKVVNGALYLIRITMRNFEEDLDTWQESSSTDGTLTATRSMQQRLEQHLYSRQTQPSGPKMHHQREGSSVKRHSL